MSLLLLLATIAAVGSVLAVPLCEFVFGALLLTPILKYGLALVLGLLGLEIVGGNPERLFYLFSFLIVATSAYGFYGRRREKLTLADWSPLIAFAVVFVGAYQLCLQWVDFYDLGERLRDYALIATAIDSPVIPKESWMEGVTLNYYVFWYRFAAMLSSVLGMEVWNVYHTIIAFSMGFYGAVIFQIVRVVLGGGIALASLGAVLIPFGPNVAGMLMLTRTKEGGFGPDPGWWGPSRVVQGAITEFPAWSFVLGDAHPHYLNLATFPFLLLLLYRVATSNASAARRLAQSTLLVIGGALFLMGSNAWEVPMWGGAAVIIGLTAAIVFKDSELGSLARLLGGPKKETGTSEDSEQLVGFFEQIVSLGIFLAACGVVYMRRQSATIVESVVVLIFALGFVFFSFRKRIVLPTWIKGIRVQPRDIAWAAFWLSLFVILKISSSHIKAESGPLTFVRSPIPVTTTVELFAHWGAHLVIIAAASLLLCRWGLSTFMMAVFLGATLLFDKGALFIYVLIGVQLVRLLRPRESGGSWREAFGEGLIIASLGLLLLPEIVFLNDSYGPEIERMNTIFKIYTTSWALMGLCALSLVQRIAQMRSTELQRSVPGLPIVIGVVIVGIIVVGAGRFYAHTLPMRFMTPSPEFGTEGLGLADKKYPGAGAIIRVLRQQPHGRVLETQGRPYSFTSFVSTLSGQPAYLGWANHVNLLTKKGPEISRREKITDQIYKETDCAKRRDLARAEKIQYIVVGSLERQKYPDLPQIDYTCFNRLSYEKEYSLYRVE